MKKRKIISIVLVLLGLVVFLCSMYVRHRVAETRGTIDSSSSFIPNNPVDKMIRKGIDDKISAYDMPVLLGTISGVVLVVIGVGVFAYHRKKH